MREFVPASELYDVENRSPIAHPAHQATDADVRRALEDQGFEPTVATPRAVLIRSRQTVRV